MAGGFLVLIGLRSADGWTTAARRLFATADLRALDAVVCETALDGGDHVLAPRMLEQPRLERIRILWRHVDRLLHGALPRLNARRALVLVDALSDEKCVQSPEGFSLAFVAEASLDTAPQDWAHELAHTWALSGLPALDEGIAVFVEHAIVRHESLSDAATDIGWLRRFSRIAVPDGNPHALGLSAVASALLLGGVPRLAALTTRCARADEMGCVAAMRAETQAASRWARDHAPRVAAETDAPLSAAYFSGAIDEFVTNVTEIASRPENALSSEDWMNLARYTCLMSGRPPQDEAQPAAIGRIEELRESSPEAARALFDIATSIAALRVSASQHEFVARSATLLASLSERRSDPTLGADIALTLGFLHVNLPDFAGGSTREALHCADVLESEFNQPEAARRLREKAA